MGYRRHRRHCRHARRAGPGRSANDALAPAKDARGQLEQLAVKPSDIKFLAVSHTHPDHIGNVGLFPTSMLLVQKAEYEWPRRSASDGSSRATATKLEGDHDVFGDGSVIIIATPGHTPGHQSLLVKLAKTGAVVLSGDAVHFKDNWENRRVPSGQRRQGQDACFVAAYRRCAGEEKAQLWINHDKAQRDGQKMAPDYYELTGCRRPTCAPTRPHPVQERDRSRWKHWGFHPGT